MAIAVSVARPKLVGTTPLVPDVITKPVIEEASYFEVPICFDNLESTPVALTGVSITSGSPTVTGLAGELANVKVGSILVTAGTTTDFATGTYVTAKPNSTTLTVSTNALTTVGSTTATATLTVDATAAILRITPVGSSTSANMNFTITISRMTGSLATDSNGNGYDEVTYTDGVANSVGTFSINVDTFATAFGLLRAND